MNIPILRYEGYEGDDTIGTLARIADGTEGFQTYMGSQDKDLGQLISSTCFLWKPGKRGNDHEVPVYIVPLCCSYFYKLAIL